MKNAALVRQQTEGRVCSSEARFFPSLSTYQAFTEKGRFTARDSLSFASHAVTPVIQPGFEQAP